jgi:hypothetical protein
LVKERGRHGATGYSGNHAYAGQKPKLMQTLQDTKVKQSGSESTPRKAKCDLPCGPALGPDPEDSYVLAHPPLRLLLHDKFPAVQRIQAMGRKGPITPTFLIGNDEA